jgi:FAD/FMN-containing dehydrogenase
MVSRNTKNAPLEQRLVDSLAAGLRGPLLRAEDPGYDDARALWNAMIDRRPTLVARCLGVADVVHCVRFAREHGLPLSIKGGGHNIAGLAVCDGGLMLDMALMRGVWVDAAKRSAHAQAGCLLGDVDRETQLHGLAAVLGFVSTTGIAGLTLGGGFGYLTRRFGWTCDNVVAMDVVTAEGRIVRAAADENADLFWVLRGGGGNYGVVTSFEYALHPVGPAVTGGVIAWRADRARDVLEFYRAFSEQAPLELACVAALRRAPPASWLPQDVHGAPIVALFVCDSGPLDDGATHVAAIKALGAPVGDVIQPRPYVSQQSLIDATQPKGRRYYWKSEYLPRLEPELLAGAIDHARNIRSAYSAILIFPLGGALNALPPDHSPMGNRDARWVLNIMASWDAAADDEANIEWARTAWRDLRRFSTGGTYVNFLTEDEGDERIRAAYGPNYQRLAELKAKWDPHNLFRINKNIAPVGIAASPGTADGGAT